jgi:hypothetical protein
MRKQFRKSFPCFKFLLLRLIELSGIIKRNWIRLDPIGECKLGFPWEIRDAVRKKIKRKPICVCRKNFLPTTNRRKGEKEIGEVKVIKEIFIKKSLDRSQKSRKDFFLSVYKLTMIQMRCKKSQRKPSKP